jgi:hypothetical protein
MNKPDLSTYLPCKNMKKASNNGWFKRPNCLKLLLIMKITVLLLFAGVLQSFATKSFSQSARISMDLKNVSVVEVLNEIESQTDFYFFFNQKLIDVDRKVNVSAENTTISDVLTGLFGESNVDYVIYDRQIILAPKETVQSIKSTQQQRITGVVTDANNSEPLIGVNIQIEGTTQGAITGFDGSYELTVPGPGTTLIFSFVGYITQRIQVVDQSTIDVNMILDITSLEEVVVIGYGVQKKKDLTGSVGVVNVEEMKKLKEAGVAEA